MGDFDNKMQDLGGKAKEGFGDATGNEDVRDEGRADQTKADFKDKASEAGDAVKKGADKVLGAFHKDDKK